MKQDGQDVGARVPREGGNRLIRGVAGLPYLKSTILGSGRYQPQRDAETDGRGNCRILAVAPSGSAEAAPDTIQHCGTAHAFPQCMALSRIAQPCRHPRRLLPIAGADELFYLAGTARTARGVRPRYDRSGRETDRAWIPVRRSAGSGPVRSFRDMLRGSRNHLPAARAERRLGAPAHAGRGDGYVGHGKRTRKFAANRP